MSTTGETADCELGAGGGLVAGVAGSGGTGAGVVAWTTVRVVAKRVVTGFAAAVRVARFTDFVVVVFATGVALVELGSVVVVVVVSGVVGVASGVGAGSVVVGVA